MEKSRHERLRESEGNPQEDLRESRRTDGWPVDERVTYRTSDRTTKTPVLVQNDDRGRGSCHNLTSFTSHTNKLLTSN